MRAILAMVVVSAAAHAGPAQQIAVDPDAQPPRRMGWNAGIGAELGFGATRVDGLSDGWVGRVQFHLMPFLPERDTPGMLVDFAYGFEYWRVGHGTWGTDLPAEVELGVRAYNVRAEAGIGVDVFVLDQVHGDTGFGLYAPTASVTAGIDIYGVTLMADARVTRRWEWGADSFTQWMFSLGIGGTSEHR